MKFISKVLEFFFGKRPNELEVYCEETPNGNPYILYFFLKDCYYVSKTFYQRKEIGDYDTEQTVEKFTKGYRKAYKQFTKEDRHELETLLGHDDKYPIELENVIKEQIEKEREKPVPYGILEIYKQAASWIDNDRYLFFTEGKLFLLFDRLEDGWTFLEVIDIPEDQREYTGGEEDYFNSTDYIVHKLAKDGATVYDGENFTSTEFYAQIYKDEIYYVIEGEKRKEREFTQYPSLNDLPPEVIQEIPPIMIGKFRFLDNKYN